MAGEKAERSLSSDGGGKDVAWRLAEPWREDQQTDYWNMFTQELPGITDGMKVDLQGERALGRVRVWFCLGR